MYRNRLFSLAFALVLGLGLANISWANGPGGFDPTEDPCESDVTIPGCDVVMPIESLL